MIRELRREYPVRVLCRVLAVSASGYHAWLVRKPSARARFRERLKLAALAAHQRTRQTYGAQRLQQELAADGFRVSLGTVKRVRRELALRCVQQKKRFRVQTTDSGHQLPVAANLLGQVFKVGRPDEVWAADITYVATDEGWLYVAAIKNREGKNLAEIFDFYLVDKYRELEGQAYLAAIERIKPAIAGTFTTDFEGNARIQLPASETPYYIYGSFDVGRSSCMWYLPFVPNKNGNLVLDTENAAYCH
jgi:transposase InsO family protein